MKQQSFLFEDNPPPETSKEEKETVYEPAVEAPGESALELGKMRPEDEEPEIFSVSQIVNRIKNSLEKHYSRLWIQGEISNLRIAPSGHCYLTLKDAGSQISAVCFKAGLNRLKFAPEDGLEVIARGKISIYAPRGQMQLIIDTMEPVGHGALQLAFEQLKGKLAGEGLFDPAAKKPLPQLPSRIGVVTSPTGAAIQDILRVLKRRNDRVGILIYPARVQGDSAAGEIVRGIRELNRRGGLDVIIIGRGGGSLEDLWPFNEEIVARAVYSSDIPIISAVGHEIDFSISDFVADLRAPTPSAAAEMVAGARSELVDKLEHLKSRIFRAAGFRIQQKREAFNRIISRRGFLDTQSRLAMISQRLDELALRLNSASSQLLPPLRTSLGQLKKSLPLALEHYMSKTISEWKNLENKLSAFSPLNVLKRGYSIVNSESTGELVRDPVQVEEGARVTITVAKGSFTARRE